MSENSSLPPASSQRHTLLQENTTTILELQISSHHPYGLHLGNISFGVTITASDHPQWTNPRAIQNVLWDLLREIWHPQKQARQPWAEGRTSTSAGLLQETEQRVKRGPNFPFNPLQQVSAPSVTGCRESLAHTRRDVPASDANCTRLLDFCHATPTTSLKLIFLAYIQVLQQEYCCLYNCQSLRDMNRELYSWSIISTSTEVFIRILSESILTTAVVIDCPTLSLV